MLACRLAYETGVRRVSDGIRILEGMRTRCMALLAVMLVSGGIVAGFADSPKGGLQWWGWAGLGIFASGALATTAASVHVARPVGGIPALSPDTVLSAYTDPALTESDIYRGLAHRLTTELQEWVRVLRARARSVTISLASTFIGMAGIALVWVDAALL